LNKEMLLKSDMKSSVREMAVVALVLSNQKISWGPTLSPKNTTFTPMKGGCTHYTIVFNAETKQSFDKESGEELITFMKHSSFATKQSFLYDLIQESLIFFQPEHQQVRLIQGMTINGDEASGVGLCQIHANRMCNDISKKSRYDFVEIDAYNGLEEEIPFRNANNVASFGQVVSFVEISSETFPTEYYAIVQYLEFETLTKNNNNLKQPHKSIFKRLKWEYTNHGNPKQKKLVVNVGLIPIESVIQLLWVAPDFSSMKSSDEGIRKNYMNENFSTDDRYIYVPRSFTDRSGWNTQVDAAWSNLLKPAAVDEEALINRGYHMRAKKKNDRNSDDDEKSSSGDEQFDMDFDDI
jgi:hypothetical protein